MNLEQTALIPNEDHHKKAKTLHEIHAAERLEEFQARIKDLAKSTKDINLLGIDTKKLTEDDMVLFYRFEHNQLSIEYIQRQQDVLAGLKREAKATLALLRFMKSYLKRRV